MNQLRFTLLSILLLIVGERDWHGWNLLIVGNALMAAAAVLTIWSMFYYLKMAWKDFK